MHRRNWLSGTLTGLASTAFLRSVPRSDASDRSPALPRSESLLFWDLWHLDRMHELQHRQGRAEFRPEATYQEPHLGPLASWPTVYHTEARWRMLYSAAWKPYSLMVAESDDGLHWQPAPQPDIHPAGKKLAPHHLFTLPSGSGGAVYLDPVASDGYRFKVFVHQQGQPVVRRAVADPTHPWHHLAKTASAKRYINEEFMLVSRDGLHWQERRDLVWSRPHWHPEPPIFGFYDRQRRRHAMTVRPGWGDRRICLQTTDDFKGWSGPELLLQPDALDQELLELYGMPVFPYGSGYVGLLWIFHCESPQPTTGFNRFVGPLDCQLAFSRDGVHFTRGLRSPFIATNPAGEPGCGAIEPSCLVATEKELRIYSSGSKLFHGQSREAARRGIEDPHSILLHTLRPDGFMYLEAGARSGGFTTKPLTILGDGLTLNASAAQGEIRYQLTDMASNPIDGFTFADCRVLHEDGLRLPLSWRGGSLATFQGKIVRLQTSMQRSRLFAVHGDFHFIDAQDRWMLEDGQSIDTEALPF